MTAVSEELALNDLRSANQARQKEWDAGNQINLAYRGNELAGEVGEACNVIKKLERERMGIKGSRATIEQLAEELADVVICADLIAMDAGIDLLGAAVPAKFNATSEKVGLRTRLSASSAREDGVREALDTARQAIEYSLDMGCTDPAGVLLQALNACDSALSNSTAVLRGSERGSTRIEGSVADESANAKSGIYFVDGDKFHVVFRPGGGNCGMYDQIVCSCATGEGALRRATQICELLIQNQAEPVTGHGYEGPFTKAEFFERAVDHEKAARNGMAAGPNVSYVRTFQACAHAFRIAAPLLPPLPETDAVPPTNPEAPATETAGGAG